MSAAEHAPAVFFADFQPTSASRSAAVSATFAGQRPPVPPLDEVEVPPEEDPPLDDPPDDEVPPEEDVLPPLEEVLPPLDDELFPPDDDPPDEEPPDDEPPDDDEDFPPEEEEEDLPPEDDPPLDDDAVGSVPFGSSVHGVGVVEAVQARAKAAADAATRTA